MRPNPMSPRPCWASAFRIGLLFLIFNCHPTNSSSFPKQQAQQGQQEHQLEKRNFLEDSMILERNRDYRGAIQIMFSMNDHSKNMEESFFLNLRLGWLHYLDKKFKNAEDYYQKALQTEPNSITAHLGLSNVLLALEKDKEAVVLLETVSARYPSDYSLNLLLANVLSKNGQKTRELVVLNRLISAYPEDTNLLNRKSDILIKQNKLTEAQELLRKALFIMPQNIQAITKLNFIQEQLIQSSSSILKSQKSLGPQKLPKSQVRANTNYRQ